uniref:Uncharacterized protein n=1 Tax=Arundo donax TaxID=35708 RepID=A0A0A8YCR5_ARUDO
MPSRSSQLNNSLSSWSAVKKTVCNGMESTCCSTGLFLLYSKCRLASFYIQSMLIIVGELLTTFLSRRTKLDIVQMEPPIQHSKISLSPK